MRSVVLLDTKIDKDEALALLEDFSEFFEKHTGIQCEWFVERKEFSVVPTVPDSDGDLKPTREYRKALETEIHKRYGDYGTDNIIMWVHQDNFLYRGIWGTNWSYNFYKYSFQLCRWDKRNKTNTFGTLYHELMHSFDTLVRKELGVDTLNTILEVPWDEMVHGASPYQYIGRRTGKENINALTLGGPYIKEAFMVRKKKHEDYVGLLTRVVQLLQTVVGLLTKRII